MYYNDLIGYYAHRDKVDLTGVLTCSDCSETFLACCVPDLSFNDLSIYIDASGCKLHSNGRLRFEAKLIARESRQKVRLPDARVTDQDNFEEIIVVVVRSVSHGRDLSPFFASFLPPFSSV